MEPSNVMETEEELEINLYDLFYLFRQKLKGIIATFILGGLLVGLITFFFIDPKYEATAKLYVVSASNDSVVNLSDLQIGSSLTADYEQLILSRPMLESVMQKVHPDVEDVEELEDMISISNPGDTRILNITVTSKDPEEAEKIANEMAELSLTWLPNIMESNKPNIAEEAIVPEKKASPSYTVNTLLGALVASVLYFGIAVVRFVHDDTIRSADEFERYFGIVPLATIPEEEIYDADEEEKKHKHKHKRGARQA